MIVVRNVFRCKPGQAKELVGRLKKGMAATKPRVKHRVLTDVAADFWTVVLETEHADLAAWKQTLGSYAESEKVQKAMAGYMDLVDGGHREIFNIE